MGFDLWSDDHVLGDYIYQPARSSPATGQTHEYKALINLSPGAGGGGGGGAGGGGVTGGVGRETGAERKLGEGSLRKGAGDLSSMGGKAKG